MQHLPVATRGKVAKADLVPSGRNSCAELLAGLGTAEIRLSCLSAMPMKLSRVSIPLSSALACYRLSWYNVLQGCRELNSSRHMLKAILGLRINHSIRFLLSSLPFDWIPRTFVLHDIFISHILARQSMFTIAFVILGMYTTSWLIKSAVRPS